MKTRKKIEFEIRNLFGDDLKILKPLLDAQGVVIPFPHLAVAKVAFCGTDIAGYAIFQVLPHAEPLWVAPEYRGGDLTQALAEAVANFARQAAGCFVSVATSEFSKKLCQEQKMEVFPGTIYVSRGKRG